MLKQALLNLIADKNLTVTVEEVDQFIANLPDFDSEIRSHLTVELWDGVSPVGNLSADELKARPDFPKAPNAKAFFIKVDGQPLYFQYHTVMGLDPIMEENYLAEAEKIIQQYVEPRIIEQATKLFLEQFGNRTQANTVNQQQLDMMAALTDIAIKLGVL